MIGKILGNRYEIVKKIGEGGMSEVYKAKCNLLNRYVAIKILKKEFVNDIEFVEKFKREATAAAALTSNNIVSIYDVGTEDYINYIVMELVEGKTLKQFIKESEKLTFNETLDIGIQIARALECAHKNGIIHRDIKPQNILVTQEGVVKVTDFGIAKAMNSATITNTNKVMGSAHYFSPEQAKGSIVDFRTDIYSLGIVLYEMTVGKVPYDGESPVTIALKHLQEPAVPPMVLNKNIPESLNNLILKSIEKDSIRRYQSIKEMLSDMLEMQIDYNYKPQVNNNNNDTEDFTRIMTPISDEIINKNIHKTENAYTNSNIDKNSEEDYEEDYEEEDYEDESLDKKKIIKRSVSFVIVLILGIFSALGYKAIFSKNDNNIEIPNIIGLNKESAKIKVEALGLKFKVEGEEESDKPKDTILKSDPNEGQKVSKNSEIKVIISKGKSESSQKIEVKNFIGIKFNEAKDMVISSNFKIGNTTYEFNSSFPKGVIIAQSPEGGEKVEPNTEINFVISNGPKEKKVIVPDLKNKSLKEAGMLLSKVNLAIGNTSEVYVADKNLDGKVISQSIESGSEVKESTKINITYYKFDLEKETKNR